MTINKLSETEFEIITPRDPSVERGTLDDLVNRLEELQRDKKQHEGELENHTANLIRRIENLTAEIDEVTTKITDVKAAGVISKEEFEAKSVEPPIT